MAVNLKNLSRKYVKVEETLFLYCEKNALYYHKSWRERIIQVRARDMKFTLPLKIFISFLCLSVLSVSIMVLVIRFFAVSSFESYIHEKEMENLNSLAETTAQFYQSNGGWGRLGTDRRLWMQLLGQFGDTTGPQPFDHPGSHPLGAPDFSPGGNDPPFLIEQKPPASRPCPGRQEPQFPPPGGFGLREMAPRISLFDRQRQVIAGPPGDAAQFSLLPVVVNGETVGWLGIHKGLGPRQLPPPDREFLSHQIRSLYWTGIIILILSALGAFVLSSHLLAPIQKLTTATASISRRNFATRVQVDASDELGQLARDFNAMARTLGDYEERQKQWLSDISHEMRTPIAVMLCEIEAMQDGIRKADAENLASLHTEVEHLGRIIADLHTLSLSEAGEMLIQRQPVKPLEALEKTVDLFKTRFEQNGIKLVLTPGRGKDLAVMGDETQLARVFSNLFEKCAALCRQAGDSLDHS